MCPSGRGVPVSAAVIAYDTVMPSDHYIRLLAVELDRAEGAGYGVAPVRPELLVPGTRRLRTGPLITMVDLVGGHTPEGPYGPTVDMRLQVFGETPTSGGLRLECRPLRVGKRLIVAETLLFAQGRSTPFGRATTTFLHIRLDGTAPRPPATELPAMAEGSFDEFLAPTVLDERTLVLDPVPRVANGFQHTVQGGAQALFAELAAQHALGGGRPMVATDVDIRFLDKLRTGPLVATVEPMGAFGARVRLTDADATGTLVSHVVLTMARAT